MSENLVEIDLCAFIPHGETVKGKTKARCVKCGFVSIPTKGLPFRKCRIKGIVDTASKSGKIIKSTCSGSHEANGTLFSKYVGNSTLPVCLKTGVITGARDLHWPCLASIAISCVRQGLGLAVADHGLKEWQREELMGIGVQWVHHEQPSLSKELSRAKNDPKAWWKPWICKASPFNRSVWIDSDAVITGDLSYLFKTALKKPCVSTQKIWRKDSYNIYSKLVEATFLDDIVWEDLGQVNSGVVAWRRNNDLIDDWCTWCEHIMNSPDLSSLTIVRDQSALVMSLIYRRANGKPEVELLGDEWNTPADNLPAGLSMERSPISNDPCRIIDEARSRHSDAKIVHWIGSVKPWSIASE